MKANSTVKIFTLVTSLVAVSFLAGCASSKMKARKEQRDEIAKSAKIYCEFINGEIYPDIDVALNLEMAKRCDSNKNFAITQYRTPSENQGVMYCCSMMGGMPKGPVAVIEKDDEKKDDKKSEKPAAKGKVDKAAAPASTPAQGDGEFIDEGPKQ